MHMETTIKKDSLDLRRILNKKMKQRLHEIGETRFANKKMWAKIAIIMIAWTYVYAIHFYVEFNIWGRTAHAIFAGLVTAAVGMNIMHDAVHGSLSKKPWLNKLIGTITLFLGSPAAWDIQHNILHHTYTNIAEMDEDISSTSLLRLTPHQKWRKIHTYQHVYAWLLYSIMTLWWATAKDTIQLRRYGRMQIFENRVRYKDWVHLILVKMVYFTMWLVIPIFFWEMSNTEVIVFFLIKHSVCGLTLGVIFQLAHAVPKAEMFEKETEGSKNTAEHQIATSVNFHTHSKFWSWYTGGLNRQVHHHLFPQVCHIHYPSFDKMLENELSQVHLEIKSYPSFWVALSAHYHYLKILGKK